MVKKTIGLNFEVTKFLNKLNHPLRNEIEQLRIGILNAHNGLTENIKWNAPNYSINNEDRITLRILPITTKQIQVIFHCGAKVKEQPKEKIIQQDFDILQWKTNDRAVVTFKNMLEIEKGKNDLAIIVSEWIKETK